MSPARWTNPTSCRSSCTASNNSHASWARTIASRSSSTPAAKASSCPAPRGDKQDAILAALDKLQSGRLHHRRRWHSARLPIGRGSLHQGRHQSRHPLHRRRLQRRRHQPGRARTPRRKEGQGHRRLPLRARLRPRQSQRRHDGSHRRPRQRQLPATSITAPKPAACSSNR